MQEGFDLPKGEFDAPAPQVEKVREFEYLMVQAVLWMEANFRGQVFPWIERFYSRIFRNYYWLVQKRSGVREGGTEHGKTADPARGSAENALGGAGGLRIYTEIQPGDFTNSKQQRIVTIQVDRCVDYEPLANLRFAENWQK